MPRFVGTTPSGRHGATHQRARRAAFAALPEWSPCARCGYPMHKQAVDRTGRSALHYDHTDTNDGYLGFSHRTCNLKAGASKGARVANARRRTRAQWVSPGPGW